MAARLPRPPMTAKERAVADRVQRAKRSYPRVDRHGVYMEACSALAEETGADVTSVYEEWQDRVTAHMYTAELDVDDCEAQALEDVRLAYRRAS